MRATADKEDCLQPLAASPLNGIQSERHPERIRPLCSARRCKRFASHAAVDAREDFVSASDTEVPCVGSVGQPESSTHPG